MAGDVHMALGDDCLSHEETNLCIASDDTFSHSIMMSLNITPSGVSTHNIT